VGTVHIKLRGSTADRFEAIKWELGRELGYVPTNPEIIQRLLDAVEPSASWVADRSPRPR